MVGPTSGKPRSSASSSTSTTCWLPRSTAVNAFWKNEVRLALSPISSAPKPAVSALPDEPTDERVAASPGIPGTELRMLTPGAKMSTELAP